MDNWNTYAMYKHKLRICRWEAYQRASGLLNANNATNTDVDWEYIIEAKQLYRDMNAGRRALREVLGNHVGVICLCLY